MSKELLDALKKTADEKRARKNAEQDLNQSVLTTSNDEVTNESVEIGGVDFNLEKNEQALATVESESIEIRPLNEEKLNLVIKEEKEIPSFQVQSDPKAIPEPEPEPEIDSVQSSEKEESKTLFILSDDEDTKQVESTSKSITNQLFEDVEINDNEAPTGKEEDLAKAKHPEKESDEPDDSSDWSLSQIPGYQQYTDEEQKKQETKKIVKGFLLKTEESKKKAIRVSLYLLLALIFLLSLAFYASFYFETERVGVSNELRKYQLIKQEKILSNKDIIKEPKLETNKEESIELANNTDIKKVASETSEALATEKKVSSVHANKAKQAIKKSNRIPKRTVKKNKIVIKKEPEINKNKKAFLAYEKGNYKLAKQLYQTSLKENNHNVVALSGLGAIAVINNNLDTATGYYQQILQVDRNNYQAKQALLSLKSRDIEKAEVLNKIQNEIIQNPNDPALKFILGNHYAQGSDWVTAQKYYFSAVALDLDNQIYTLNLAISMDKLGMHKQALQFYKKTIELAEIQGDRVDTSSVINRISVLADFIEGND